MTLKALSMEDRRGFALVELLVLAAIAALIFAILLPQVGAARKISRLERETGACLTANAGHGQYMNEYKDAPIVGYSAWSWGHPYNGTEVSLIRNMMFPLDPERPSVFIEGSAIKMNGLRFRGFTGLSPEAFQIDRGTLSMFQSRPRASSTSLGWFGPYVSPVPTDYQGALAVHNSWGLNTTFVGGDYLHGAFDSTNIPGRPNPVNGEFYLTRLDRVNDPSRLIFMASARAADVNTWTGAWYMAARSDADGNGSPVSRVRPGYYKVMAPQRVPDGIGSTSAAGGGWGTTNGASENNTWDATRAPSYFGYLDGRNFGKPVVAHVDGHVESLSFEQLRDMTRWSNYATERNWTWRRR